MKKRTTMLALLLATGAGTCLQAQEKLTQFKVLKSFIFVANNNC